MFYGAHSTAESVSTETSDNEGANDLPPLPHKSIGQRIADEDYSSEKANNVLTTVAQEHRASRDENSHENVGAVDVHGPLGTELTKTISPREEQEIAAEREEVKHLDLAIAARSPRTIAFSRRELSLQNQSSRVSRRRPQKARQMSHLPFSLSL